MWMTGLPFEPMYKSISIDKTEQYLYIANNINPIVVAKLEASTGNIVTAFN